MEMDGYKAIINMLELAVALADLPDKLSKAEVIKLSNDLELGLCEYFIDEVIHTVYKEPK